MKTRFILTALALGLGLALAFLWLLTAGSMPPVYAANYTVTNANASGAGSLRQAILDANGNAGRDTINFDISGAIVLTDALPAIVDNLIISGPGAEQLEISGAGAYRVFQINSGFAVTITGVTARDGLASRGGGIWSAGTLHLDNVRIVNNSAPFGINGGHGGGLYVWGGSTVLSGTQVLSNTADNGGGLYVQQGSATLSGTQVAGNTASYGGGLCTRSSYSSVTLSGTQVTGNMAYSGGGVYVDYGSATLNEVQVFSNTASYRGGGVYVRFSSATLNGTQVAGNTANYGGGLYVEWGSATLNGGGIADNDAASGSGVYQHRGNITVMTALTVTGDIRQAGGVFAGSSHDLHIVGALSQTGGHFYAPDAPHNFVLSRFVHTGGTYHQTQLVNDSHDVGFPQAEKGGGVIINANGRDLGRTEVSLSAGADCAGVLAGEAVAHCYIIAPTLQSAQTPDAAITFYYNDSEIPPIQSCAEMEAFRWDSSWNNILKRDSSYGIKGRMCGDDPQSIKVIGVTTFSSFVLASEPYTVYLPLVLRGMSIGP